jgi:hypothetical protein
MSQFERDLRESLRRRQPPPGFAEDVLERTRRTAVRSPFVRWLAVAALFVVLIGGGALVWQQHRQAEGEKAKQQLMVGLRITGSKLQSVQKRIAIIQQHALQPQQD